MLGPSYLKGGDMRILIFVLGGMFASAHGAPIDWVNPFIGTATSSSGPKAGVPGGGKGGATTVGSPGTELEFAL